MKKYYGPLVLGVAALTLGTMATQTTVHADENTDVPTQSGENTNAAGDKENVGTPTGSDQETDKSTDVPTDSDQNTGDSSETPTTPEKTEVQIDLENKLASIDDLLTQGYGDSVNNLLEQTKAEYTKEANSATDDTARTEILNNLTSELDSIKDEFHVVKPTGVIQKTGEKIDFPSTSVHFDKDQTTTKYYLEDSNYNFISKDGKSTSHDITATLNNNTVTFDKNYLDDDGNFLLQDTLTTDNLKDSIKSNLDLLKLYQSNDQKDLDSAEEPAKTALNAISKQIDDTKPTTSKELHEISQQINDAISKNTTTIFFDKTHAQGSVPIVKNGTVRFNHFSGKNHDEWIAVTFNADGTKLTAAKIVDKDGNEIKSNTKIHVMMGDLKTGYNDLDTVANHNQPLPSTGGTTTPVKKPSTDNNTNNVKPSHSRSVYNNVMTFYSKPGTYTPLYDLNGNTIKTRGLAGNSSWYADKLMDLDGVQYVRVASNEWARLSDGLEITPTNETITTKNDSALFTAEGKKVKNRALAKNTSWRTDRSAVINGHTMYRVATNEWVGASDLL